MTIQFTAPDGNCPNPMEVLNLQYLALAQKIRSFVCTELAAAQQLTSDQIVQLQSQLTALTESDDLLIKLGELQEFLNSLDGNGDGQLDALVNINNELQALEAEVATIKTDIAKNASDVNALKTDLNSFKTTTNSTINQMNITLLDASNRASDATQLAQSANQTAQSATQLAQNVNGKVNVNSADIATIKAELQSIVSFDDEKAQQMADAQTCYIFSVLRDGLEAAIATFDAEIDKGCVVNNPVDPAPIDDMPPVA